MQANPTCNLLPESGSWIKMSLMTQPALTLKASMPEQNAGSIAGCFWDDSEAAARRSPSRGPGRHEIPQHIQIGRHIRSGCQRRNCPSCSCDRSSGGREYVASIAFGSPSPPFLYRAECRRLEVSQNSSSQAANAVWKMVGGRLSGVSCCPGRRLARAIHNSASGK